MFNFIFNPNLPKADFYVELATQVKCLIEGERNWVTNTANVSSLIFHGLNSLNFFKSKPVNWVGFYVKDSRRPEFLILGPFQGKVACTRIKYGKGVCGTAAATGETQVVPNVHDFPGHIACDSGSNSEIVVPLTHPETKQVFGVLDIDGLVTEAFTAEDQTGLEEVAKILVAGCEWDFL